MSTGLTQHHKQHHHNTVQSFSKTQLTVGVLSVNNHLKSWCRVDAHHKTWLKYQSTNTNACILHWTRHDMAQENPEPQQMLLRFFFVNYFHGMTKQFDLISFFQSKKKFIRKPKCNQLKWLSWSNLERTLNAARRCLYVIFNLVFQCFSRKSCDLCP